MVIDNHNPVMVYVSDNVMLISESVPLRSLPSKKISRCNGNVIFGPPI